MRPPADRVELSDGVLVDAAKAGDRRALAELLSRHRAMLLGLCQRTLGDENLAEDAAQEAALAAMLGLDRLRQPASFGAWLAGIGLNICRRWMRQRPLAMWSWEAVTGGVHWKGPQEVGLDPAEEAVAAELALQVRRAVGALPLGQRRAVALRYFAGMTQVEVAAELGIPVSAVKTRLHKGRSALRGRLLRFWRNEMTANDTETLVPMEPREILRMRSDKWPAAHVVVLTEVGGERELPIWIGEAEATWLALAVEKADLPRPGPHALLAQVIQALGGRLLEVRISRLTEEVFYAELVCEDGGGARRSIDARPSDALNLAAVLQVPILAAPEVVEAAGMGPAGERIRRVLTAQRAEVVEAGAAELVAEARERWSSSLARVKGGGERVESESPDESAVSER